ncbi:uncharacterized protein LOC118647419 [Monomorium pharaonis]|uniref:uncharacterized protein LOC118647419 n=1 Tax=Monomorium pharaonis TaxID=307658 RepID=UPI0017471572|nr:uncharacterized protein LOC118647419 [Monomorium pharaonis]
MASSQKYVVGAAEIILSTKSRPKINIDGFKFVKDKNRGDVYYWICERKSRKKDNGQCIARAITILINGQHIVRKFDALKHNHAGQADKPEIEKTCNKMKQLAKNSNDQPAQIVNNVVASTSQNTKPCLPSKDALRHQIKRIRRSDTPTESKILDEFSILNEFLLTISGKHFCKDIKDGSEKILVFTTSENLKHLQEAKYWIMDGTFKTVPTVFRQMYTIHADVGSDSNSRVVPLVYALISSKSEEIYKRLFQELNDWADEFSFHLQPVFVLTDFEKAVINAVNSEFLSAQSKGCFTFTWINQFINKFRKII